MKESTENWLKIADKDFRIAEICLKSNEPFGVIFHLHACIEKILKAVYEETNGNPPKIHGLKRLAINCCNLELEDKMKSLLDLLDKAYIDSRYPESVEEFEAKYNIESCKNIIIEVRSKVKWLKSLLTNN